MRQMAVQCRKEWLPLHCIPPCLLLAISTSQQRQQQLLHWSHTIICKPSNHQSLPSSSLFTSPYPHLAAPVIGWLLRLCWPPTFVIAHRHATIKALLAGCFSHQLSTTALRRSRHQLLPAFAASIIGWLLHCCPSPTFVITAAYCLNQLSLCSDGQSCKATIFNIAKEFIDPSIHHTFGSPCFVLDDSRRQFDIGGAPKWEP